jgi:hypothetical protein
MRSIATLTNITPPDTDLRDGRIRDDDPTHSINGTPVNEALLGDITQFFSCIMQQAHDIDPSFNYNNIPDGVGGNDFQLQIALNKIISAAVGGWKVINIGSWNMQSLANLSVAHGLSSAQWKTISSIDVMILNDAANTMTTLTYDVVAGSLAGHVDSIDAININMTRTSGALYDSSGYSGSSNRGFISIRYTP